MRFKVGDVVRQTHMSGELNHWLILGYGQNNTYTIYWIEKDTILDSPNALRDEVHEFLGYSFKKVEPDYVTY